MKKYFFTIKPLILTFVCTLLINVCFGNQEINLRITSKDASQITFLFGYNHGTEVRYLDSISTNKPKVFAILHPGVYSLLHNDSICLSFYIPEIQDVDTLIFNLSVLQDRIEISIAPKETFLYNQIRILNKNSVEDFKNQIFLNKIDSSIIDYCYLFIPPNIPGTKANSDTLTEIDQLKQLQKLKRVHYLDNVNFANSNLIYFPAFIEKIDFFLDNICPQQCNILYGSINGILNKTEAESMMNRFLLEHFIEKYEQLSLSPVYEYVFVNLLEEYILTDNTLDYPTSLLRDYQLKYNRRKPNSLMVTAPDFILTSNMNKTIELHEQKSAYTLLFFYDYECSACQEVKSELIKVNLMLKRNSVKVFSLCMGESQRKWKKDIENESLENWIYCFNNSPNDELGKNYHISRIPTLYLLDEQKKIVMKNFHLNELVEFFK